MGSFLRHFNFLSRKLTDQEMSVIIGRFIEKRKFMELAICIAVTYISNALSKCKVRVYEDGKEVENDLSYKLNVSPNPNQSASEFMNSLVKRMCHDGDALVYPYQSRDLFLARSFHRQPNAPGEDYFENIVLSDTYELPRAYISRLYYFKLNNPDVRGLVAGVMKDYGTLMDAAMRGFKQTRGRKFKLALHHMKADDPNFQKEYENTIKANLKEFVESDTAVFPQFEGYDLSELPNEAAGGSSDIIDMRKEIFDVVAQAWKIPNSMMYGNMTNTAEIVKQFLTFAVDPVASAISREFTRKSFTQSEWARGSHVQLDTKTINHIDILDVADKVEKLISSGSFSIDMVLDELGYQKLNTEFSQAHWITKNYSLIEEAMKRIDDGR